MYLESEVSPLRVAFIPRGHLSAEVFIKEILPLILEVLGRI